MWVVLFTVSALAVNCESYSKSLKSFPGRNQRIIKVQGPPYYNHFNGHHKPIRSRPYGLYHGDRDEFIRPNHPPPIPPFFKGPSTNHIKHLSRPPPHVFHKSPSYGLGFPYKTFGSFRPTPSKDHFRVQTLPSTRPAAVVASSGSNTLTASNSYHSPTFTASSYLPPPIGPIISSDDNNGPIREIPAPNLALKPNDDSFGSVANVANVANVQTDGFVSSFGKEQTVDVDAIVKDSGLENTYLKQTTGDIVFGKEPTVEIANFEEGSSLDVTNLIKDSVVTSEHNSGYEVTEHDHLPSNDQIIKGHDGTKLYYAPDPDPSLPVHKVPPTTDPHSTPSNGQNVNNAYLPPIPHSYSYLQGSTLGGSVGTLSSHEVFHLMNGYPAVISQPVVAFVNQPQTSGLILPGSNHGYFHQPSGGSAAQYSSPNDLAQYLSHSEIHNLIHNSHDSHQDTEGLGASHSAVVNRDSYPQQSVYSPQNQYRNYLSTRYQSSFKNTNSNSNVLNGENVEEINHNYQYEPEASESDNTGSLTVIRQTKEGSLSSETVKELLLEDSSSNDLSSEKSTTPTTITTILQLKNIPEVPFYASLPNKQAAEAFATLQAAGSVANNYMNRIKIARGNREPEKEQERRERQRNGNEVPVYDNHKDENITKGEVRKLGSEKTVVEIQQSVPLYETTLSSKNLLESTEEDSELPSESQIEEDLSVIDFKKDDSNEIFGRRIRPK